MAVGTTVAGAPANDRAAKYNVNVLSRAIRILRAFTVETPAMTLSDIASKVDLSAATTLRILSTLHQHGMVLREQPSGRYSLGYDFLRMSEIAQASSGLPSVSEPIMRRIRDAVNETVIVSVREDDMRVNLTQVQSRHELRRVSVLGIPRPLYVGASGKAILAGMPIDQCEAYIERVELVTFTPHTIVDKQKLRDEVALIRARGYAESQQEQSMTGGHSVAAALIGPRQVVAGALSISLPASRMSDVLREELANLVREGAREISQNLEINR